MSETALAESSPVYVVIPLYNDWDALTLLFERIRAVVGESVRRRMSFLIVDDCSSEPVRALSATGFDSVRILHLYRNVGHQKAIALGLSYLADTARPGPTIVMDSDGEDKPEDIERLLAEVTRTDRIVFAHRAKRHEGPLFRIFYEIYKWVFKTLTGKVITFGNFSAIPHRLLRRLAHVSEIWNNYPGGIIRSRLPYGAIPLERGRRLAGQSKMNFVSLILHGLSAVSVLMDATAVRILIFCVLLATGAGVGIAGVILFRLSSDLIIPGWASYLVFSLFIVIMQAFLISLLLVFIVLTYRTQQPFIPALQYQSFIERIEEV